MKKILRFTPCNTAYDGRGVMADKDGQYVRHADYLEVVAVLREIWRQSSTDEDAIAAALDTELEWTPAMETISTVLDDTPESAVLRDRVRAILGVEEVPIPKITPPVPQPPKSRPECVGASTCGGCDPACPANEANPWPLPSASPVEEK